MKNERKETKSNFDETKTKRQLQAYYTNVQNLTYQNLNANWPIQNFNWQILNVNWQFKNTNWSIFMGPLTIQIGQLAF